VNRGVGDGGDPADDSRLDELERKIVALPDQLQAGWARDLDRLQRSFSAHVQTLAARVDHALTAIGQAPRPVPSARAEVSDELYAALEERFRGSTDEVERRQQSYVADIRAVPAKGPVLDLGCGRGEFLTVLRRNGIDAVGVDASEVAVAECVANGLDARRGDLLDELQGWPVASLAAVSLLQVAEHLPFDVLLQVMQEARRVLRPSGLLLVETPNGANQAVAASTFWLDPTHVRPLHPLMLDFLAERAGFVVSEIRGSASSTPPWRLPEGEPASAEAEAVRGLQAMLLDDQDVTLLAHVAP
jgi:SAM-dependent methyltransferase